MSLAGTAAGGHDAPLTGDQPRGSSADAAAGRGPLRRQLARRHAEAQGNRPQGQPKRSAAGSQRPSWRGPSALVTALLVALAAAGAAALQPAAAPAGSAPAASPAAPPAADTSGWPASSRRQLDLADHLRRSGFVFYGAWWCPACRQQKQLFGQQAHARLPYVECESAGAGRQRCEASAIEAYPTWVRGSERQVGVLSLEELEQWSGFRGARPAGAAGRP